MVEFLQFTLSGISFGMIYAAIALSLVLIWRGTRLLNFAQGGMAMFTTYIALEVIYHTGSYWAGFVVALAAGIVLGAVAELTVIRPTLGKPELNAVIITIGLLILLEGLAGIFYGGQYRSFPAAFSVIGLQAGSTPLGVSRFDVFVAVAVLAATLLLAVGFRYTSAGLRMRAAAFNATVARLSGIRVARVITVGWALAGLLGALAGVLVSPSTFLYPNSMDSIFVFGFTAAVIGGLDSPAGAVVGGLLLGVALSYAGGYLGSQADLAGRARHPRRGADAPARRDLLRRPGAAGMTMRSLPRILGAALVTAALVAILSIKLNAFRDYQIAEIAIEVTAVAGLTVLTGLSGQISLGNGAFMAIGAYTTALLLLHLSWPFIAVLVVAAVVTAAAGAIVGVAAARLHGPYLAGATLMLGVALPSLAYVYPGILGGDQGLNVVFTTPGFLGVNFPLTRWQAWVCSAVALVTLVLLANLGRSRVGRNWRAVRDDEVAAALAGVNVARARVLAFVVSATCAGMAGALLAIVTELVAPGAFTITLSIALLTAAVIGGLGTLPGAVWGSLVIVLVPTYATDVATSHGLSTSVASNIPIAAYGVVLILVMLIFPQGIQGGVRWLLGLLGISAARTWRPASMPDGRPPAGEAPASQHEALLSRGGEPPEPHEKEGTQ